MNAIIVGARADGHANVVFEIMKAEGKYTVVGFIDDNKQLKGTTIRGIPVLGGFDDLKDLILKFQIHCGIVAIGDNPARRKLAQKLVDANIELINAVHPSAIIDSNVIIGKGNYIGQGVILVTGTKVGNCVNIHTGATIDHDNIIEDGANIGPGVHTAGRVKIGKDAFLGTGTVAIPDTEIGEGAIVGAGSVVIKNVDPFKKVVGVPVRQI